MDQIEVYLKQLRVTVQNNLLDSRAKSLVLTKIDEAELWLTKCADKES